MKKHVLLVMVLILTNFTFAQNPRLIYNKIEKGDFEKAILLLNKYELKKQPYYKVIVHYGFAKIYIKKAKTENSLFKYEKAYNELIIAKVNFKPQEILTEIGINDNSINTMFENIEKALEQEIKTRGHTDYNSTDYLGLLKNTNSILSEFTDKSSYINKYCSERLAYIEYKSYNCASTKSRHDLMELNYVKCLKKALLKYPDSKIAKPIISKIIKSVKSKNNYLDYQWLEEFLNKSITTDSLAFYFVSQLNNPIAYKMYLNKYPNGVYKEDAILKTKTQLSEKLEFKIKLPYYPISNIYKRDGSYTLFYESYYENGLVSILPNGDINSLVFKNRQKFIKSPIIPCLNNDYNENIIIAGNTKYNQSFNQNRFSLGKTVVDINRFYEYFSFYPENSTNEFLKHENYPNILAENILTEKKEFQEEVKGKVYTYSYKLNYGDRDKVILGENLFFTDKNSIQLFSYLKKGDGLLQYYTEKHKKNDSNIYIGEGAKLLNIGNSPIVQTRVIKLENKKALLMFQGETSFLSENYKFYSDSLNLLKTYKSEFLIDTFCTYDFKQNHKRVDTFTLILNPLYYSKYNDGFFKKNRFYIPNAPPQGYGSLLIPYYMQLKSNPTEHNSFDKDWVYHLKLFDYKSYKVIKEILLFGNFKVFSSTDGGFYILYPDYSVLIKYNNLGDIIWIHYPKTSEKDDNTPLLTETDKYIYLAGYTKKRYVGFESSIIKIYNKENGRFLTDKIIDLAGKNSNVLAINSDDKHILFTINQEDGFFFYKRKFESDLNYFDFVGEYRIPYDISEEIDYIKLFTILNVYWTFYMDKSNLKAIRHMEGGVDNYIVSNIKKEIINNEIMFKVTFKNQEYSNLYFKLNEKTNSYIITGDIEWDFHYTN